MASLRREEWKTAVEVERARAIEVEWAKAVGQARLFQSKMV